MSHTLIVGTTGLGSGACTKLIRAPDDDGAPAFENGAANAMASRAPDVLLLDVPALEPCVTDVLAALEGHPLWRDVVAVVTTSPSAAHGARLCERTAANGYRVTATCSVAGLLDQLGQGVGWPDPNTPGGGARRSRSGADASPDLR